MAREYAAARQISGGAPAAGTCVCPQTTASGKTAILRGNRGEIGASSPDQATLAKHAGTRHANKDVTDGRPGKTVDCETCGQRQRTFCAALPTVALKDLAACRQNVMLGAKQTLFEQSERAAYSFLVTDGYLKVYSLLPDGRCVVHGFMGPGDHLGLAVNGAYAYFAATLTPSILCRFKRLDIERLCDRYPGVARRLLTSTNDELIAAQNQVVTLGRKSAVGKLASFLVMMRSKMIAGDRDPNWIFLPMS